MTISTAHFGWRQSAFVGGGAFCLRLLRFCSFGAEPGAALRAHAVRRLSSRRRIRAGNGAGRIRASTGRLARTRVQRANREQRRPMGRALRAPANGASDASVVCRRPAVANGRRLSPLRWDISIRRFRNPTVSHADGRRGAIRARAFRSFRRELPLLRARWRRAASCNQTARRASPRTRVRRTRERRRRTVLRHRNPTAAQSASTARRSSRSRRARVSFFDSEPASSHGSANTTTFVSEPAGTISGVKRVAFRVTPVNPVDTARYCLPSTA